VASFGAGEVGQGSTALTISSMLLPLSAEADRQSVSDPPPARRQLELFQPSLIKLDEIEISLNIFAPGAAGFFEKMIKARALGCGIGMT
jgi:hypothetical protein